MDAAQLLVQECPTPMDSTLLASIEPWVYSYNTKFLQNVKTWLQDRALTETRAHLCIFAECGCGFNEWSVFDYLLDAGLTAPHIILMDTNIEPSWVPIWQQLADERHVQLTVLDSYIALNDLTSKLPDETRAFTIYIHGHSHFGEWLCHTKEFGMQCLEAAISYWRWCQTHSLHDPVNFLYGDPIKPSNATSWDAFADIYKRIYKERFEATVEYTAIANIVEPPALAELERCLFPKIFKKQMLETNARNDAQMGTFT